MPHFAALSDALAAGRVRAATTSDEHDPELVVVFDLAGTVRDLYKAVEGISGLEFLAEMAEPEAEPDDDFVLLRDGVATGQVVPETLYTAMSNARAAGQLVGLFEQWQRNPAAAFPIGLAPLKTAFSQLRAVRRWGPEDRVRETGLLESWREDVAVVGASQTLWRVEIELWYRSHAGTRATAEAQVRELVRAVGGTVLDAATLPAIRYHALLVDLPPSQIQTVLAEGPGAIALLAADSIAFVLPAGPMSLPEMQPADPMPPTRAAQLPTDDRPRVALLDGLPASNHNELAGRLIVDDPDDHASRYQTDRQQHGTAMASLICHGDLSSPGPPLTARIYVRPVLEPHPFARTETLVQDSLFVDVIHRSFVRMFGADGARPPVAPSVRIINLSIGDPTRMFVRRISPLATLLDWLAHQYNVLILVSAGNHPDAPELPLDLPGDPSELQAEVLRSLHREARRRRLHSPAEAINVVTVGALHADGADASPNDSMIDPTAADMPAGYSATGSGHRRSVKPEVFFPGGRRLLQRPVPGAAPGQVPVPAAQTSRGPGLLVASPGAFGDSTSYGVGTSHATALATRAADGILGVLAGLVPEGDDYAFPDGQYHPVLTKALLVHAADWGDMATTVTAALGLKRSGLAQLLGYGRVDPSRVATASRSRVVLLGAGSIMDGQRQRFELPLPSALSATKDWRRLTLTLAWMSPVNPRALTHRMVKLKCDPPQSGVGVNRRQVDHHAVGRGTVQHEILEGTAALPFLAGDTVGLNVECRVDPRWQDTPTRYGLVASIEMATSVRADIHAQVREALRAQARSRTRVMPRG